MADLLRITGPNLLDKMFIASLGNILIFGSHDVTASALRVHKIKSAKTAAEIKAMMGSGNMSLQDVLLRVHLGSAGWEEMPSDDDIPTSGDTEFYNCPCSSMQETWIS
ncbi:hypothetical protein MVEN_00017700 [Mycena venus]|uniref:Uncharacterized protein n=1 Tax=Mycena venus TaxID=2733690 RepID=A0A8H7DFW4_9AGAR|nr:hypothetical protein MVEN_00017700 [Mycena venus]